jgi:hypothetical protein
MKVANTIDFLKIAQAAKDYGMKAEELASMFESLSKALTEAPMLAAERITKCLLSMVSCDTKQMRNMYGEVVGQSYYNYQGFTEVLETHFNDLGNGVIRIHLVLAGHVDWGKVSAGLDNEFGAAVSMESIETEVTPYPRTTVSLAVKLAGMDLNTQDPLGLLNPILQAPKPEKRTLRDHPIKRKRSIE